MNVQEKYQRLEDTVRRYNPGANFELIRSAFRFAEEHHRGQNRKDGSPFITHPLAVAQIVAEELHLDSESIAAALLHDTIEDTDATHEDIARTFSPTIADIVEGVSKRSRDQLFGRTEQGKVVIIDRGQGRIGDRVRVRVTESSSATLKGIAL